MNWTILSLLREVESFFAKQGISSPRLEAEILLGHVLSLDRIKLYADFSRPIRTPELDAYRSLVMQRVKGTPAAYLIGEKEFFSLPFRVSPAVLIPRPETEELVQAALDLLPGDGAERTIADLGCGSGCIALTLLKLKRGLRALAVDRSGEALEVTKWNAQRLQVEDRLSLFQGDLLEPLRDSPEAGRLALLLCNPPYVDPAGELPLDREVVLSEPQEALFTPPGEPLHYYARVLSEAAPFLGAQGSLIFELGAGMADAVRGLGEREGWRTAELRRDLAGIERVVRFVRAV